MIAHWRVFAGVVALGILAVACTGSDRFGTAWGDGAFDSGGERIYFTGTSERGGRIDYSGGVDPGGMMMAGRLSCASCHGTDARGGTHVMHMDIMDAPNIRWVALSGHGGEHEDDPGTGEPHDDEAAYDLDTFRMAVTEGLHPDGQALSEEMPRWEMSAADLADLADYLQSFSAP
jgi:mono/diheme cytochrome c family protein